MRLKPFNLLTKAGLILAVVSVAAMHGKGASSQALLKTVTVAEQASGSELWLGIEGEYSFQTVQAADDTVLVDLLGAQAAGVAPAHQWQAGLLAGYRLLPYTDAAHRPVVRVLVELKHPEPFRVQKEKAGLRVLFGQVEPTTSSADTPATSATPSASAPAVVGEKAQPSMQSKGLAVVSGISLGTGPSGEPVVDVLTSRPVTYRVLHLQHPARVVVDLEEARFRGRQRMYAAQSPVLRDVRVGQFRDQGPAVVRVVADLAGSVKSDVHAQLGGVRIELKPRSLAKLSPTRQAAKGEALPSATAGVKPDQEVAQASLPPATPEVPAPQARVVERKVPGTPLAVLPSAYQNLLPASAGSRELMAAPRHDAAAKTPESLRAARAAKILKADVQATSAAPQGQTAAAAPDQSQATQQAQAPPSQTAQAQPTAPAVPTSAPASQAAPAGTEKPQYTGEPISLNLKDVDLKDFFRLIHEISGLNIIIDPNVAGSVTLVLDSVPWDQALDIVLKNNRLDKTLEGNVLRIARVETLAAEQEEIKKLADARVEAQPLVTVFRPVNYAKASTIATMLKSWVGGGALSKRGNVLVDDRANTLIISDIQSQMPVIASIITKLDTKAKQISIEARVVLASSSFQRSLTSTLQELSSNNSGSTHTGGVTGIGGTITPTTPPTVVPVANSGFGVFAISNASSHYAIDAAISAAETKSLAKTLSRPTIVTQNNIQGMVQQGSQIPIQTTINNTISITYVSATLQLTVTPQVTEDGNIFLVINVQNATPGPALTSAGPSINTQQATTQVLVPDGGTVVFGGVTVSSRSKSATYIPLIGNIPIIGNLFKSSNVQDSDNELLFFVTPKVLTT